MPKARVQDSLSLSLLLSLSFSLWGRVFYCSNFVAWVGLSGAGGGAVHRIRRWL